MKTYTHQAALLLVLLAAGMGTSPASVIAQDQASAPLFVAMPEHFPDLEARAVLMLEPGRDIVVLNRDDASPETLDVALGVLARMRRDHPRPPDRGQLVPITGFVHRSTLDPEKRAGLSSVLAELRERPLANVGNLGLGRWMQIR